VNVAPARALTFCLDSAAVQLHCDARSPAPVLAPYAPLYLCYQLDGSGRKHTAKIGTDALARITHRDLDLSQRTQVGLPRAPTGVNLMAFESRFHHLLQAFWSPQTWLSEGSSTDSLNRLVSADGCTASIAAVIT